MTTSDFLPERFVELSHAAGCTLPTTERPLRLAEFEELFISSARQVDQDGRSVVIRLSGAEGLVGRVRDLAARETSCCSFFDFEVEGTDDDLRLSISVPEGKEEILDALTLRARGAAS